MYYFSLLLILGLCEFGLDLLFVLVYIVLLGLIDLGLDC